MEATEKIKLSQKDIQTFSNIIGEKYVCFDPESLENYGHDETEKLLYLPSVVLKVVIEGVRAVIMATWFGRIPNFPSLFSEVNSVISPL